MREDYHQLLHDKVSALSDRLGRPIDYIEVGVCTGNSAEAVLATGKVRHATLIDNWSMKYPGADVQSVLRRLTPFVGKFELLSGHSSVVLARITQSFDVGFVDGDHEDSSCRNDMEKMLPLLRIGGVMFVDDMRQTGNPDKIWLLNVAQNFASKYGLPMQEHAVHNGLAEFAL